jgi:site-specific recombinase XerD
MNPPHKLPLLADAWLCEMEGRGATGGTVRAYRAALRSLAEHLRGTDYTDATKDDLRGWLLAMRNGNPPLAQNTIRQRVIIIKPFYKWLIAEGELDAGRNPTATLRAPAEIRPDVQTLTEAQVKALLATCTGPRFEDRRDHAILCVLLDAGLRRFECAGLLLEDLNLPAGTLHVVGKGSSMRGPRHRTATIGRRTRAALTMYLRARHRMCGVEYSVALWLSRRHNQPMTTAGIRYVVEQRGQQAGLKLHAHMVRHTWADEFRRGGGNEGDLMVLGGWTNRRELDRYGRSAAEDRAIEAGLRHSFADRLRA